MAQTTFYDSLTDTWGGKDEIKKARNDLSPSFFDVRKARHLSGLTLQEAADVLFVTRRAWENWESHSGSKNHRKMPPAYAQLFALKTGLVTVADICPHLEKLINGRKARKV